MVNLRPMDQIVLLAGLAGAGYLHRRERTGVA